MRSSCTAACHRDHWWLRPTRDTHNVTMTNGIICRTHRGFVSIFSDICDANALHVEIYSHHNYEVVSSYFGFTLHISWNTDLLSALTLRQHHNISHVCCVCGWAQFETQHGVSHCLSPRMICIWVDLKTHFRLCTFCETKTYFVYSRCATPSW